MSVKLTHARKAARYLRLRPKSGLLLARCLMHNMTGDLMTLTGSRRVRCNLCSWHGARFAAYPDGDRLKFGQRCPACESSPRYRLFARYLESSPAFSSPSTVLLEFAPEPCFQGWLRRVFRGTYRTADLRSRHADVHTDLMRLGLRTASVDVVLCSHVLEHVPDDLAGLREIRRVLKPSGWCILLVPWIAGQASTIEYGRPNPLEHDHYRRYGEDFARRVSEAGFEVTEVGVRGLVSDVEQRELGLPDGALLRADPRRSSSA